MEGMDSTSGGAPKQSPAPKRAGLGQVASSPAIKNTAAPKKSTIDDGMKARIEQMRKMMANAKTSMDQAMAAMDAEMGISSDGSSAGGGMSGMGM